MHHAHFDLTAATPFEGNTCEHFILALLEPDLEKSNAFCQIVYMNARGTLIVVGLIKNITDYDIKWFKVGQTGIYE